MPRRRWEDNIKMYMSYVFRAVNRNTYAIRKTAMYSEIEVKNYVVSVKCVVSVKKYVVSVKCAVRKTFIVHTCGVTVSASGRETRWPGFESRSGKLPGSGFLCGFPSTQYEQMLGNFRCWTPDSFHRHYHLHFIQTLNNLDVDTAS
ncbi:hypothetical protein ANN_25000 [Periplaneta americana]|uniref:Uncharacterized protein n=1 Tax=Periplaneta americana TaxID=6978 RepID=A0ABQ8S063_PERAM|nr:hypothetical protein ANN_25000 [Periplaneta americana]